MSTTKNHWLLPEGINELLPEQARKLEFLRRQLLDSFATWGYELVITPFVEYLDSLLTGTGQDLELQTVKMTDLVSGRLLGIRADITPQAARIDAHQLRRETPTRLCYIGTVFRNTTEGLSGSRAPLQIGAELYGHAGPESDGEILSLMLNMLQIAGLDDVYLDLGHVGIFKGLARQAGLDAEQESALFEALQRKAMSEIDELLASWRLPAEMADMLRALAHLNGSIEVLDQARKLLANADEDVRAAIEYVAKMAVILAERHPQVPVHYDLAELRAYQYQTGVVFAAFAPGSGQEIARGGRYDHIGEKFGRARAATGFSADLKTLMDLGTAPDLPKAELVLAPGDGDAELESLIQQLRTAGTAVIRHLPGQIGNAEQMGCTHVLELKAGQWVKTEISYH